MNRNPVIDPLRETLREPRDLPMAPDADDMLRRVRRARRRRTNTLAASGAAALAVVALAAGTVVTRFTGTPTTGPATQPNAAATIPATPQAPADLAPGLVLPAGEQVRFADAEHVYAVLMPQSAQPYTDTTLSVAASGDGGRTWQVHPVPGTAQSALNGALPVQLQVLDASRIVLHVSPPQFSADAGATWTPLPNPVGVVDTIPAGGGAIVGVEAGGGLRVVVVRPDGTTAKLAHVPPGGYEPNYVSTTVTMAADGSAWITGSDGTSDPRQFVSRDRGRSWTELHAPGDSGVMLWSVENGTTIFVFDPKRYDAWRSTDGGQNWTRLPLPGNAAGVFMTPMLDRGDGSLLVGGVNTAETYLLAPGASEFQILPWDAHVRATRIGAGYLQAAGSETPEEVNGRPTAYLISPDRAHWVALPFKPFMR